MEFLLVPFLQMLRLGLHLYTWVVMASVVLTWLVLFQILNPHQPLVRQIGAFCFQATEPFLAFIRRLVPFVGGIDLSPLLLLLAVYFLKNVLDRLILSFF